MISFARLFSPRSLCLRFLLLLLAALSVQGTGAAQLEEARVSQVIRDVKILPKQAAARPARISDEVRDGSAVRTGVESRAELTFTDQTLARLGANTIFTFNEGTRNLELGGGAMLLRVPKNAGGAQINTAAVTAAITGTTIMLEYHHDAFIKFIVLEVLAGSSAMTAWANPSSSRPGKCSLPVRRGPTLPTGRCRYCPLEENLGALVERFQADPEQ